MKKHSNSNLLTVEQDFHTPMLDYMFYRPRSKPQKKPLAGIHVQFAQNPKWQVCYGGR